VDSKNVEEGRIKFTWAKKVEVGRRNVEVDREDAEVGSQKIRWKERR
jgi:hypothetical protein